MDGYSQRRIGMWPVQEIKRGDYQEIIYINKPINNISVAILCTQPPDRNHHHHHLMRSIVCYDQSYWAI